MTTVLITGANGFIGSRLAAELAARHHVVWGSCSSEQGLSRGTEGIARKLVLPLGQSPAPGQLSGVEIVIHCAHDLRRGEGEKNVTGTLLVADAARRDGVDRQIFVSSYSAHSAAVSEYGRSKLALQRRFLDSDLEVVRPGLVIGAGGLFARLFAAVRAYPAVPVVGGRRTQVPVIALRDLVGAMATVVEERRHGIVQLFDARLAHLRDLLATIRDVARSRTLLVPVPFFALVMPLRIAERAGLRLSVGSESFAALRVNRDRMEHSDLTTLIRSPMSLDEMVKEAARELDAPSRGGVAEKHRDVSKCP